jgi:hypothetical protein
VTGCHARAHHPRHFGIRKPVLTTGAPQMLRAFVFEAIVLAAFALFVCTIVAWSGILHSGVRS